MVGVCVLLALIYWSYERGIIAEALRLMEGAR